MMLNWHYLDEEDQLHIPVKQKSMPPRKMSKKVLLSDEPIDKIKRKKDRHMHAVPAYAI